MRSDSQTRSIVPTPDEFLGAVRVALYRHFDRNGELLYIGITTDPGRRWHQHTQMSPWARFVTDVTVHWLDSRKKAQVAERRAIGGERPLFNRARPSWDVPRERRQSIVDHQLAYLRTGVSGLFRRARCRDYPEEFCLACGPDADAWLEASFRNDMAARDY